MITQLSIFIQNTKGTLEKVLRLFKNSQIQIITTTLADTQDFGICQGGALFTLADLAFAAAVNKRSINTLTTGANITYVKPAQLGDILNAEAHELVNHHRMPFAEVKITNQKGELLAIFTASGYRKEPRPQS